MDDLLKWLWKLLKNHPTGWFVALLIVIFAILEVVSLFSDLGFSQEVTKYRYYIYFLSLALASLIVLFWLLVVTILENNSFNQKLKECENDNKQLKEEI